jgi:hypothetical protein
MTNEKECFGQRSEGAKEEGVQEGRSSGDELPYLLVSFALKAYESRSPYSELLNSCNSRPQRFA